MEIIDLQVSEITRQYISYVELLDLEQFELAADYLVMAATLTEIKSKVLLPKTEEEEEEEDPRAALIRRLQLYEIYCQAAQDLDNIPRLWRDNYLPNVSLPVLDQKIIHPDITLLQLCYSMLDVIDQNNKVVEHSIKKELLSVNQKMIDLLNTLNNQFTTFTRLCMAAEGRLGVVVTFIAIMELVREQKIELVQTVYNGVIHLRLKVREKDE